MVKISADAGGGVVHGRTEVFHLPRHRRYDVFKGPVSQRKDVFLAENYPVLLDPRQRPDVLGVFREEEDVDVRCPKEVISFQKIVFLREKLVHHVASCIHVVVWNTMKYLWKHEENSHIENFSTRGKSKSNFGQSNLKTFSSIWTSKDVLMKS